MQAFLKEFFGGEHKDYAQVFQSIDVPRFLIEGHTKIMQIRRDYELSETAHHAVIAEQVVQDIDKTLEHVEINTKRAVELCQAVWQQVKTAQEIGHLFDESQSFADFSKLSMNLPPE